MDRTAMVSPTFDWINLCLSNALPVSHLPSLDLTSCCITLFLQGVTSSTPSCMTWCHIIPTLHQIAFVSLSQDSWRNNGSHQCIMLLSCHLFLIQFGLWGWGQGKSVGINGLLQ